MCDKWETNQFLGGSKPFIPEIGKKPKYGIYQFSVNNLNPLNDLGACVGNRYSFEVSFIPGRVCLKWNKAYCCLTILTLKFNVTTCFLKHCILVYFPILIVLTVLNAIHMSFCACSSK